MDAPPPPSGLMPMRSPVALFAAAMPPSRYPLALEDPSANTVNQYSIRRTLGKGSFGKVYAADTNDGRQFAIKSCNKTELHKRKRLVSSAAGTSSEVFSMLTGPTSVITPLRGPPRSPVASTELDAVYEEVALWSGFHHAHCVELVEVLEHTTKLFMVMEQCGPSVLACHPTSSRFSCPLTGGTLSERRARDVVLDMLHGLQYLHSNNVSHGDIKPDNVLLRLPLPSSSDTTTAPRLVSVLADFGKAKKHADGPREAAYLCVAARAAREMGVKECGCKFSDDTALRILAVDGVSPSGTNSAGGDSSCSLCSCVTPTPVDASRRSSAGTPAFSTPEAVRNSQVDAFAADMWALGVTLYCLLAGALPFTAEAGRMAIAALQAATAVGETGEEVMLVSSSAALAAAIVAAKFEMPSTVVSDEEDRNRLREYASRGVVVEDPRAPDALDVCVPLSPVGRDFLSLLLDANPTSRPTAAQALTHPWLDASPEVR